MIKQFLIAATLAFAAPSAVFAQGVGSFEQYRDEAAVTVASDKAYLLLRVPEAANSIFFLRVPTQAELAAYEAAKRAEYERKDRDESFEEFYFEWEDNLNLYEVRPKREYVDRGDKLRVQLVAVPAGEYVVYGLGYNNFMYQCNCLGTVGFEAQPGVVTDLGTYLISAAWEPSPYPELKGEADLGRVARMDYGLFAFGIRPVADGDFVPSQIAGASVVPAQYAAVGPWVDLRRVLANRLAAMPGVLEYPEGIPVDVATGKELRLSLSK